MDIRHDNGEALQGWPDPDTFTILVQRSMQSMYKVARLMLRSDADAADAIQDAILTCWEKRDALRCIDAFHAWIIRILVNRCKAKQREYMREVLPGQLPEPSYTEPGYTDSVWMLTLQELDERYRIAMVLFYVDRLSTAQIAWILDIPEATVRTRLARGRKQLRQILGFQEKQKHSRKGVLKNENESGTVF